MLKDILGDKILKYIKYNRKDIDIRLEENFKVSFLAQGEYNINFIIEDDINKYVFRVNTKSQLQLDNQIRYEYNALKNLEISSVTPRVFFVDDTKQSFDYGILIMEFLEGRHLEYDRDLYRAAKVFSKIHAIDVDKIGINNFIVENNLFAERVKEAERLLGDFFSSPDIENNLKNFFISFLDWTKKNITSEKYFIDNKWHVINNTEVNSANFIIGKDRDWLIDWEKPVISDPCQDITQFLAVTTTLWKTDYILSKNERKDFFKAYLNGLGDKSVDIEERVHMYEPYLYLRALSWCAYAYIEYLKPDKEIKNMDTFNKIKQYLDLDFMRSILREYITL